jgi:AcrR family transcriptional regulator
MARPRTEPVEVRRGRILDAARGILIRNSYHELNLDEVAAKADVAKGTLYLYFKDKDDLLIAVFVDMLDRLERHVDETVPADGTERSLERLIEEELALGDETHYFLAPFSPGSGILISPKAGGPEGRARFLGHISIISRRVKACVDSGVLRPIDPMDGTFFIIGLLRMAISRKVATGDKRPMRERAPELLNLLLNGLGSRRRS